MNQTAQILAASQASNDLDALKGRVRDYWQANPCGVKFAEAEPCTKRFYELVTEHRYRTEWHIPAAADFASAKGLCVLEIGCGLGTDGAGNPLSRVYSRAEATELFRDFAQVPTAVHFLNKRWLPVVGNLLPRTLEKALAARWGWHLWIYARK